jgi:hypothetical protein
MRIILSILLVLALATSTFAADMHQSLKMVMGSAPAASCATATGTLGNTNVESSIQSVVANRIYIRLVTLTCDAGCSTGSLSTAYLYHNGTGEDNAKVCLYLDDGDDTPDSGDSLVGCTSAITTSTQDWATGAISGSVTCGSKYFIGMISDATSWASRRQTTSGTGFYQTISGSYTTPPSTLSGTWTSETVTRSLYVTVTGIE